VAARLNARPRKTLEYQTPAAMLAAIVASTPWIRPSFRNGPQTPRATPWP